MFSRRVVGWRLSAAADGPRVDALEMGIWTRDHAGQAVSGLTHHSDKGVQYVAIRYTERLAEAGAAASVGSTGDSWYDNAWPRPSTRCSRLNWSATMGPGRTSTTSRSRPRNTSTGSITGDFTARSARIPPVEPRDTYHHNHPAPAPADAALASL